MRVRPLHGVRAAGALAAALLLAGCGDVARQSNAPAQVVVTALTGASGATPDEFGGTLNSDVITNVRATIEGEEVQVPTVFNDLGRISMQLILRDPGRPGVAAVPTPLNQVTFTRYRVRYIRADGRNTPGIDVPWPFDSAATVTVSGEGTASVGFQLVRHTAKEEAPLLELRNGELIISTIAEVTFYGADQAGNEVNAVGQIGIDFGNFGDPN